MRNKKTEKDIHNKFKMYKMILIFIGSASLCLGIIGIVLPGLPTTPFLLLSAALYCRSSEKLYNWLCNHKLFGKYITNYRKNKSLSLQTKILSILTMWTMVSLSTIFFVNNLVIDLIIVFAGVLGTITMVFIIPTTKK